MLWTWAWYAAAHEIWLQPSAGGLWTVVTGEDGVAERRVPLDQRFEGYPREAEAPTPTAALLPTDGWTTLTTRPRVSDHAAASWEAWAGHSRHLPRGRPDPDRVRDRVTHFVKLWSGPADAAWFEPLGQALEWVPLAPPLAGQPLALELRAAGRVAPFAPLQVFGPDGGAQPATTDFHGRVLLPWPVDGCVTARSLGPPATAAWDVEVHQATLCVADLGPRETWTGRRP